MSAVILIKHYFVVLMAESSGYVALAVASKAGTEAIDLDTGRGTDREQNMLAFAVAALNMLRDYIQRYGDTG